ncbi:MAG: hypothetical protein Q6363_002405 [Candidatus Njordarchaeota archaeon]
MSILLREKEKQEIVEIPNSILPLNIEESLMVEAPYGYCPECKVALEYNSETDEVYCPICGRIFDSFIEFHAEVKYARPEPESEDIQIHRKLTPQDRYSIESNIRRKHLDEAIILIKRAAKAIGLSESHSVVEVAVDIFAKYLKLQKTRSDNLRVSAYAAFLLAARSSGYAITEEALLRLLKEYDSKHIRKLAKQIRAKRRDMAALLKIKTSTLVLEGEDQPIKLLEVYRHKLRKLKILNGYEGAIIQKVYELWNKAKSDLVKLNKTAKSITTALTYVATILVLPEHKRIKIRQFDISDIFQTTPITIREILPTIMKYLTPEEQKKVKACMRRGRRSTRV